MPLHPRPIRETSRPCEPSLTERIVAAFRFSRAGRLHRPDHLDHNRKALESQTFHLSRSCMPSITFIEYEGAVHTVEAQTGRSVMQAAVDNMVPGIIGDCGGYCSCATCHGYIERAWLPKIL